MPFEKRHELNRMTYHYPLNGFVIRVYFVTVKVIEYEALMEWYDKQGKLLQIYYNFKDRQFESMRKVVPSPSSYRYIPSPPPSWFLQCFRDKCSKSAQQGTRHKNAINMNRKCACNSLVTTVLAVSKSRNLYWPSWISSPQHLKLTQFPAGMCLCSLSLVYSLMLQSFLPQRERHMKVKMYLFYTAGSLHNENLASTPEENSKASTIYIWGL